ncbi:uncharacterized protein AB675_7124 [Cyphellophora attinorum]|uniref:Uncharacterized protein n=1 Tax=Cyphellophora attinorum TaxID=1664694 RepID=A0A0N1HEM8_9EURO|nr:uncharacterized protein AB675_7124 [Phialophora attinorum]KPI43495.1 hypothetical protein AB675_7124 [Phialophora attinorum]
MASEHERQPRAPRARGFPRGCVVLLNGYPDNHLTIDPAMAAHPDRGPEYQRFRAQLRQLAFRELKSLEDPDIVLFMTACLGDNDEDAAALAEHIDIARVRNVPFLSFTLECDTDEMRGRISAADRLKSNRFKLADPGA